MPIGEYSRRPAGEVTLILVVIFPPEAFLKKIKLPFRLDQLIERTTYLFN